MSKSGNSIREIVELAGAIDRKIAVKQCNGKKESVLQLRREIARLLTARK